MQSIFSKAEKQAISNQHQTWLKENSALVSEMDTRFSTVLAAVHSVNSTVEHYLDIQMYCIGDKQVADIIASHLGPELPNDDYIELATLLSQVYKEGYNKVFLRALELADPNDNLIIDFLAQGLTKLDSDELNMLREIVESGKKNQRFTKYLS